MIQLATDIDGNPIISHTITFKEGEPNTIEKEGFHIILETVESGGLDWYRIGICFRMKDGTWFNNGSLITEPESDYSLIYLGDQYVPPEKGYNTVNSIKMDISNISAVLISCWYSDPDDDENLNYNTKPAADWSEMILFSPSVPTTDKKNPKSPITGSLSVKPQKDNYRFTTSYKLEKDLSSFNVPEAKEADYIALRTSKTALKKLFVCLWRNTWVYRPNVRILDSLNYKTETVDCSSLFSGSVEYELDNYISFSIGNIPYMDAAGAVYHSLIFSNNEKVKSKISVKGLQKEHCYPRTGIRIAPKYDDSEKYWDNLSNLKLNRSISPYCELFSKNGKVKYLLSSDDSSTKYYSLDNCIDLKVVDTAKGLITVDSESNRLILSKPIDQYDEISVLAKNTGKTALSIINGGDLLGDSSKELPINIVSNSVVELYYKDSKKKIPGEYLYYVDEHSVYHRPCIDLEYYPYYMARNYDYVSKGKVDKSLTYYIPRLAFEGDNKKKFQYLFVERNEENVGTGVVESDAGDCKKFWKTLAKTIGDPSFFNASSFNTVLETIENIKGWRIIVSDLYKSSDNNIYITTELSNNNKNGSDIVIGFGNTLLGNCIFCDDSYWTTNSFVSDDVNKLIFLRGSEIAINGMEEVGKGTGKYQFKYDIINGVKLSNYLCLIPEN